MTVAAVTTKNNIKQGILISSKFDIKFFEDILLKQETNLVS